MAKSRVYGVPKLRRTLRRLPEEIAIEVRKEVKENAEEVLADMRSEAPHSSVRENLSVKISRDGFTAQVGLIGKRANKRGFLGRIFEFGAKAHVISPRKGKQWRRRTKGGGTVLVDAQMVTSEGKFVGKSANHPGMGARPWFFAPFRRKKPQIIAEIKKAIGKAMKRASGV